MTGELAATSGHHAATLAGAIVNTLRVPLLVLNGDLRVIAASPAFCQRFKVSPEQTTGCLLFDLGNGQWDIPALRGFLGDVIPRHTTMEAFEVEH
jgi:PAS domain-containing protein